MELEELTLLKLFTSPKAIHKFDAIPMKIIIAFFYKKNRKKIKIHIEPQRTPKS